MIFILSCNDVVKTPKTQSQYPVIDLDESNSCNYSGTLDLKSAYSFKSDNDAEMALSSIMKYTGLPTNFTLTAADVENAAAVIYNDKRYILYNQKFMEDVRARTKSKYGPLSILSHEIAHHLAGHTLLDPAARPELELEADRFSGFIMAKMGATMNDACLAIEAYIGNTASTTHPGKRTRLAAIVNGWKEAMEGISVVPQEVPSDSPEGSYIINVVGTAKYLTIRNRSLSAEEFRLGNSGTAAGNIFNKETVIMNISNGTALEVLSSINRSYYVKAQTERGVIYGYIVKTFAGKPTISRVGN